MKSLIEKFKKEHKDYVKRKYPELTKAKEIKEKSDTEYLTDLKEFNKELINGVMLNTEDEWYRLKNNGETLPPCLGVLLSLVEKSFFQHNHS